MSTNSSLSSANLDGAKLRQLISAWCDGVINEADLQQLQASLSTSDSAREIFLAFMQIHAHMQGHAKAKEYLETFTSLPLKITDCSDSTLPSESPALLRKYMLSSSRIYRWRWGWAALLLIGVFGWNFVERTREDAPRPSASQLAAEKAHLASPTLESDRPPIVLARVTDHSEDCQWFLDQGSQTQSEPPQSICSGETIRATKGMMKLTFTNGTVVTLHAPALFQVISNMRARVLLGTVTTRVAEGAEGFSVLTPRATVIDLGTEFGIQVTEVGATDVVVFKGEVNLDYVNQEEGIARRQRLRIGEGMHLDALGTASRIVAITDERYSDSPSRDSLRRPPVITAVRDNILRDAWNYYEIVPGAMREDVKAFADREAHEWNGVTTRGMPAYLLGGDYVKTFNNDKVNHDIEISVTLNRAAKLYVLFDKRIPPPQWLTDNFRNTGDEIGVDEGPFYVHGVWYTNHHPGVGPGVSVDNVSSIWVRDVKGPCSVKLGPTESTTVDINMYGIVAVPTSGSASNDQQAKAR
ncbi:MAG TPA: FecR family protein [Pirellulales bacterium]|jgi:hypothetical protein|nr:FecR family protein [Pirellulales bacterium]